MAEPRLPEVAIVGRPNVGKSTLFNRVLGRRQAIVGKQPGMTRDRNRAAADWCGRSFLMTDTGGIEGERDDGLPLRVQQQALRAVETAAVVIMMVDGRDGPLPFESEIAAELRRRSVPLILAVNKCDTRDIGARAVAEFLPMDLEPTIAISAEQGIGVGDLLDLVVERLPEADDEDPEREGDGVIRVTVVGRPNVGKSSLVNALLGSERVVVSDIPGTTRDSIDTDLESDGVPFRIIDTAGIRRGGKRDTYAEVASVAVARRRMVAADVALLLMDASEGLTRQDLHIAAEAEQSGCGLVIVVNKWDTVIPEEAQTLEWVDAIHRRLGRMSHAPCTFVSALEKTGIESLLPLVREVQERRAQRIPTAGLNQAFDKIVARRGPPGEPAAPLPKYLTQVGVCPPRFVVFTAGGRRTLQTSYRRYLENGLRAAFDFRGTPIVIRVRRSSRNR